MKRLNAPTRGVHLKQIIGRVHQNYTVKELRTLYRSNTASHTVEFFDRDVPLDIDCEPGCSNTGL